MAILGMDKVYSWIQLSYDLLNDGEAKSCFRLCCLFPEDYDVPIEKLVFYGKGLELFEGIDSLKETSDRVDSIINKLKNSFLLLDGRKDGHVKMHDILCDFAISISSKDEHPYLVRCEKEMKKWPETHELAKCSAISIMCEKIKDGNILVDLRCPNLKLLQFHVEYGSCELSESFFEGSGELRVVDIKNRSPLPPLTMQKELRTLLIHTENDNSEYQKLIEILGNMKNLEIFSLLYSNYEKIKDFPVEIGQLYNLRCLRVHEAVSFEYMPPGVWSKLVKLEELALPLRFKSWGVKEEGGNRVNGCVDEIGHLWLTSITIGVPKGSVLAEELVESVKRFQISFEGYPFFGFSLYPNVLYLQKVESWDVTANWTSILVRKCDGLLLESVRELKNLIFQQSRGNNGFPCTYFSRLKALTICFMDSLEDIFPCLPNGSTPCFPNLTWIEIYGCHKVRRVFPILNPTGYRQLLSMKISYCEGMEEIFYEEEVDDGNQIKEECSDREVDHVIVLPRLKVLYLREKPKLRNLYNGNHAINCPSLVKLTIEECNNMEALSSGLFNAPTTNEIRLIQVRQVKIVMEWLHFEQGNKIQQLIISNCHEMKYFVDTMADHPDLLIVFISSLRELM